MENSLLNKVIDYSLFSKYSENFFVHNLICPISEDDAFLYLAVCKESKLEHINQRFSRKLKFLDCTKSQIKFVFTNLELKKRLYKYIYNSFTSIHKDNDTKEFFDLLIEFAINNRASDIHIEASKKYILFRFRIDGNLKTFFVLESKYFKQISSYIKLISNLDITQSRLAQDGRYKIKINKKEYDFRVSILPIVDGESIVIRVLDNNIVKKDLDKLGFSKHILNLLNEIKTLKQGLVLIAGPTGSGKTTTIYSFLNLLNSEERKIITVEDPVEYKIDNIQQVSVNNKIGLTFSSVLKNILRQDPDVLVIGEIRDEESLKIALQASLTGHLVISTIHSNSALQTISRLVDLNADLFLLSTSLKYILSQRLVLSFCQKCQAKGCEFCNYTKYYDRLSIAEIIKIDETLSSMILKKESISNIKKYLLNNEFKDILADGLSKVNQNLTSKEEVYKVLSYE